MIIGQAGYRGVSCTGFSRIIRPGVDDILAGGARDAGTRGALAGTVVAQLPDKFRDDDTVRCDRRFRARRYPGEKALARLLRSPRRAAFSMTFSAACALREMRFRTASIAAISLSAENHCGGLFVADQTGQILDDRRENIVIAYTSKKMVSLSPCRWISKT